MTPLHVIAAPLLMNQIVAQRSLQDVMTANRSRRRQPPMPFAARQVHTSPQSVRCLPSSHRHGFAPLGSGLSTSAFAVAPPVPPVRRNSGRRTSATSLVGGKQNKGRGQGVTSEPSIAGRRVSRASMARQSPFGGDRANRRSHYSRSSTDPSCRLTRQRDGPALLAPLHDLGLNNLGRRSPAETPDFLPFSTNHRRKSLFTCFLACP